jgi:hypothetical protein
MSEEKAFEINQQSFGGEKEIAEEFEGLQKDTVEFNQVLLWRQRHLS